jgi:hypothetical protein
VAGAILPDILQVQPALQERPMPGEQPFFRVATEGPIEIHYHLGDPLLGLPVVALQTELLADSGLDVGPVEDFTFDFRNW